MQAVDPRSVVAYRRDVGLDERNLPLEALEALVAEGVLFRVGSRWYPTPEAHKKAKGSRLPADWQDADIWILRAVLLGRGDLTLDDLIATADYLNHGIPSVDELFGALNRLKAGGLVGVRKGGFYATERARELEAKAQACDPRDRWALQRLLRCPCCGVRLKQVTWRVPLDDAAVEAAVAAYTAR